MVAHTLLSANFPYYYAANIHTGQLTDRYDADPTANGFFHRFYDNQEQVSNSLPLVLPYLYALCDRSNLRLDALLRVRAFLSLPTGNTHNGFPHIDIPNLSEYKTALVYVAGNDGDTILYREQYQHGEMLPDPSSLTEECRVTPIPNSGLVFDGYQFHTGLLPVTSKVRLVLNYNFTVNAEPDVFVSPATEVAEPLPE